MYMYYSYKCVVCVYMYVAMHVIISCLLYIRHQSYSDCAPLAPYNADRKHNLWNLEEETMEHWDIESV